MDITNNSIDVALLSAIKEAHGKAEETTVDARNNMQRAINNRILCAGLVEKAKQMHKQNLAGFLSEVGITGTQVKAYLSLHDAASKRPALHDKRQLLLCGILEAGDKPEQPKREPMPILPPPRFAARWIPRKARAPRPGRSRLWPRHGWGRPMRRQRRFWTD